MTKGKVIEKKATKAPAPIATHLINGQIPLFAHLPGATSPPLAVKSVTQAGTPAGGLPEMAAEQIEELHDLIMAQYDMALYERRIFLKVLEQLPESIRQPLPGTADLVAVFEPILIDARQIIADSDLKGESAFEELKKATKNLIRHVCHIAEADGLLQVGLMSSAKYLKGKGQIRLHIDPALHPYLLKVRGHFSLDTLRALIKFRSYYAQCFYEWFQKVQGPGKARVVFISYQALRVMLGIEETEYERYYDFKRFVLGQAQKELKGTPFAFDFKEKRSARKVVGLHFYLSWTAFR